MIEFIHSFFEAPKNKFANVKDLQNALQNKLKKDQPQVKLSTLYRYPKQLKHSRKKVLHIHEKLNIQCYKNERMELCKKIIDLLFDNFTFVYLDETSFHLGNNFPNNAWSKRGKQIFNKVGTKSNSLLCAMSPTQLHGAKEESKYLIKWVEQEMISFHLFWKYFHKIRI